MIFELIDADLRNLVDSRDFEHLFQINRLNAIVTVFVEISAPYKGYEGFKCFCTD